MEEKAAFLAPKIGVPLEELLAVEPLLFDELYERGGQVRRLVSWCKLPFKDLLSLDPLRRTAMLACDMDPFLRAKIPNEDTLTVLLTLDLSLLQDAMLLKQLTYWFKNYNLPLKPLLSLAPDECREWLERLPENLKKLIDVGISFDYLLALERKPRKDILYRAFPLQILIKAGLPFKEIEALDPDLKSDLLDGSGDNITRAIDVGLPLKALLSLHPMLRRLLFEFYLIDPQFRTAVANTGIPLAELLTIESKPDEKILLDLLYGLHKHPEKANALVREFIQVKRKAQLLTFRHLDREGFFSQIPRPLLAKIASHTTNQKFISTSDAKKIADQAMAKIMETPTGRPVRK